MNGMTYQQMRETMKRRYSNEMYSIVNVRELSYYHKEKPNLAPLFEVERVHKPFNLDGLNNLISVSLFCQNVDNKRSVAVSSDSFNNSSKWYQKYYSSLKTFLSDFNNSIFYNRFKIRIYLGFTNLGVL